MQKNISLNYKKIINCRSLHCWKHIEPKIRYNDKMDSWSNNRGNNPPCQRLFGWFCAWYCYYTVVQMILKRPYSSGNRTEHIEVDRGGIWRNILKLAEEVSDGGNILKLAEEVSDRTYWSWQRRYLTEHVEVGRGGIWRNILKLAEEVSGGTYWSWQRRYLTEHIEVGRGGIWRR